MNDRFGSLVPPPGMVETLAFQAKHGFSFWPSPRTRREHGARNIKPDWNVFGDSNYDGYRRAQFRYIGETLNKPEVRHIPAGATRLSVMYVPPGEGNAPHTHPVEEVFFILKGNVTVFFEEEDGRRLEENLGPWDCVSCPAGVIHGFQNNGLEPAYLQVMVGQKKPEPMGYADLKLDAAESQLARK